MKKQANQKMNKTRTGNLLSEDICYSPEDIVGELKHFDEKVGFSKEVPFHQSPPYVHFPWRDFLQHSNSPKPY